MVRKQTFTGRKADVLPEGTQQFMVCGEVKIKPISNGDLYLVPLQFTGGMAEQAFFANNIGPLLRALGCTETSPDCFDWDTTELEGRTFTATITHKADKNDSTKIRSNMSDINA